MQCIHMRPCTYGYIHMHTDEQTHALMRIIIMVTKVCLGLCHPGYRVITNWQAQARQNNVMPTTKLEEFRLRTRANQKLLE